jgi:hypothetical protein
MNKRTKSLHRVASVAFARLRRPLSHHRAVEKPQRKQPANRALRRIAQPPPVPSRISATASGSTIGAISRFLPWGRTLPMIVLCSTVWAAAAIAHAHELPSNDSVVSTTSVETGWWSPGEPSFTVLHFVGAAADSTRFETSRIAPFQSTASQTAEEWYQKAKNTSVENADDELRTSSIRPSSSHSIAMESSSADQRGDNALINADVVVAPVSVTSTISGSPVSLLNHLGTRYFLWQKSLADSSSLTDDKRLLVYPLLQFNFVGRTLPITLYIPPLRGSDTRW